MKRARVAVAVSGEGRSLRNLWDKQEKRAYEISAIIASRPDCGGAAFSREKQLALFIADFAPLRPDRAHELETWLKEQAIDFIVLAGFLKSFPCFAAYNDRMINIHPALLPRFGGRGMYGMRVHRAVAAAGETISGASVHFVSEGYDEGAIIAQKTVALAADDDVETIARKVFATECALYPEALDGLCRGTLPLAGGKIFLMEDL